jgi:hypothetical protein
MKLIYINELGKDYKGQNQYEFIFSEDTETIEDEWFIIPSSDRSVPPRLEIIDAVGLLKDSDLILDLVQKSDFFGVIDAVDGIISLGWEPFDFNEDERVLRLSFKHGETIEQVKEKLATRSLQLIIEIIKHED